MSNLTQLEVGSSGVSFKISEHMAEALQSLADGKGTTFALTFDADEVSEEMIAETINVEKAAAFIASCTDPVKRGTMLAYQEKHQDALNDLNRAALGKVAAQLATSLATFRAGWSYQVKRPRAKGTPIMELTVIASQKHDLDSMAENLFAEADARKTIVRDHATGTERSANVPDASGSESIEA